MRTSGELCLRGRGVLTHPHRNMVGSHPHDFGQSTKETQGSPADRKKDSRFGLVDFHCKFVEKTRAQAVSFPAVACTDPHCHGTFPAQHLTQPSLSLSRISPQARVTTQVAAMRSVHIKQSVGALAKEGGEEFASGNTAPWEFMLGHPTDTSHALGLCFLMEAEAPPFPGSKFPRDTIPPLGWPTL